MKISIKLPSGNTIDGSISKNLVTIGRSNKADFVVNDESLSRIHCQVDLADGQFFITDLGSSNGVYVDGNRLDPHQKHPFSTYMQLMIGPFECSIQDDEQGLQLEEVAANTHSSESHSHSTTSPTREKKPKPHISKQKPQSKKDINPKVLIFIFAAMLITIYVATKKDDVSDTPVETSVDTTKKINKIENNKPLVPNEFSSKELYLSNEEKKSCSEEDPICREFQISSENQEGIVTQGVEVYIFFKPSKLIKQPHLAFLKDKPDAKEVLSHFMVLSSSLMEQLESRKIEQIHLLMLDDQNQITKVIRYHASQFESGSNERFDLLEAISSSIRAQDIKEIAQVLDLKIPSKAF